MTKISQMQLDVVMAFTYTIYDAVVITKLGIRHAERLTVLSPSKLKIAGPATYEWDDIAQPGSTDQAMLKATGANKLFTLTSREPEGKLYLINGGDEKTGTLDVQVFNGALKILTKHDEVDVTVDLIPVDNARQLFTETPGLVIEQADGSSILASALARGEHRREMDSKHGYNNPDDIKRWEALKAVGEAMQQAEANGMSVIGVVKAGESTLDEAGNVLVHVPLGKDGSKVELLKLDATNAPLFLDGQRQGAGLESTVTEGYVGVEASDFENAGLVTGKRIQQMEHLRVAHIVPPVYHELPDDPGGQELRGHGYVGYWQFTLAAIGEKLAPNNDRGVAPVAFSVTSGMRVLVKDQHTINPVGSLALPVEVYERLNDGKRPEHVMSEEEVDGYNAIHGYRVPVVTGLPN